MRKITPLAICVALVIAACGGDDASPTTTVAQTTSTAAEATTTTEAATTTVPETTTTEVVAALPGEICERIDVAAVREAMGVDDLRAGSPFGVTGVGTSAICRFAVTYSGNFGTGFNIVVYGPAFEPPSPFDSAYDLALDRMDAIDVTNVDGVGVRAAFFTAAAFNDSATMVVEYEGGWVVEAYADNDNAYGNPPNEVLRTVIDDIVAPTLGD